ncbi:hypothetical protein [Bacteroides sp. 51]|uniref:hypothetical protein n=1 Tax=Bacteroides sp. 51 TaxID=2302938 RepID=UPI0013D23C4D|nr:hypothetical protein [Bacteroides sp. 51]NDV81320.1 hypothetical protein [Bacteroides sp. 51]
MDIRARIIDKYMVDVLDIDELKQAELFRFNQGLNDLNSDEESEEYKAIKAEYDATIQELDEMAHFSESETPQVGEYEIAVPYYEEIEGVVYQKWEVRSNDPYLISMKIGELKKELANEDYKITKCYEASLIGEPAPYDVLALHQERQAIRDKINGLENQLQ